MEGANVPNQGINVLALIKGGERYVFLYDDQSSEQLLKTISSYAADPELNFSWYDAAILSQRICRIEEAAAENQVDLTLNEISYTRVKPSAA